MNWNTAADKPPKKYWPTRVINQQPVHIAMFFHLLASATAAAPRLARLALAVSTLLVAATAFAQPAKPLFSLGDSSINVFMGAKIRPTILFSQKRPFPSGSAYILLPKDATGEERSIDLNARASNITLAIQGPKVGSFRLGGTLFAYFTQSVTSETYGFLPAMMFVELKNDKWRFALGQNYDVFAARLPEMVDYFFALAASGCAGNSSRGQLRAERYVPLNDQSRFAFTVAASEPITTFISPDLRNNTADNGVPNLEYAIKFYHGKDPEAWVPFDKIELGISGVQGSYRVFRNDTLNGSVVNLRVNKPRVMGIAGEYGFRLSKRLGIQGEVYTGQALGNYLGAIQQTTKGPLDAAVRSTGFWAEGACFWKRNLQTRFGYGQDQCREEDLKGTGIQKNQTVFSNLIWDINSSLQVGVELTWKKTSYLVFRDNAGVTSMLMAQLRF